MDAPETLYFIFNTCCFGYSQVPRKCLPPFATSLSCGPASIASHWSRADALRHDWTRSFCFFFFYSNPPEDPFTSSFRNTDHFAFVLHLLIICESVIQRAPSATTVRLLRGDVYLIHLHLIAILRGGKRASYWSRTLYFVSIEPSYTLK